MHKVVLRQFDITWLPIGAMFIFLVCFIGYFYWTMKKSNQKFYEDASLIVLSEQEEVK